jgi:hypothetical protein
MPEALVVALLGLVAVGGWLAAHVRREPLRRRCEAGAGGEAGLGPALPAPASSRTPARTAP